MGAKLPLLLKPRCPPADDPRMIGFLELVAGVTGATWVALEILPGESEPSRTYEFGTTDDRGSSIYLEVGEAFSASLRIGKDALPAPEIRAMLSGVLATALECSKLKDQTTLLRAALDSTSSSVLLFDDRGDILYANPPADQLLSLQTEDDLLVETPGEPEQPLFTLLSGLVDRLVSGDSDTSTLQSTLQLADASSLACEVSLLPSQDGQTDTILVLLQPFWPEPAARLDAFATHHGLSPREQEVVQLLVEGLTTMTMAERLGISPHTVRDHLKNLYRKTNSKSRSELLGLISRASTGGAGVRA